MDDFAEHVKIFSQATEIYDLLVKITIRAFPMNFRVSRADLPDIGETAMKIGDEMLEKFSSLQTEKPHCQSGCSFCCYLGVDATIAELYAISHYLKESLTPEELQTTKDYIRSIVDRLEGLDHFTRIPHRIPCSMLDIETGTCRVYSVRPLFCRGYNSVDRDRCEEGWVQAEAEWTIPNEIYQQTIYNAIANGVDLGLRQAQMIDGYLEFNRGLLKVLEA